MLGSKSEFFFSDEQILRDYRKELIRQLEIYGTKKEIITFYMDAYDYFCVNPNEYDGTTILGDVEVIPNLDIWAMLHDYMYIEFNVASNIKFKFYSDKLYAKEMERMGQSWEISWVRFSLLSLSTIFFTPYQLIIGKRMSNKQKKDFLEIYNTFYLK